MNIAERIKVVRAMETIARCVNDEEIFESWLMCGVADGDITNDTQDEDLICYCEKDKDYRLLMELFLRIMRRAEKSGGLYSDKVVTNSNSEVRR